MFNVREIFKNILILLVTIIISIPVNIMAENLLKQNNDILKSASELDYPPFCLVTPDGNADGFSVDLLKAVAHSVSMDINFEVGPWYKVKQKLIDGKIDVLPLVSYSEDRDKFFDFTAPYLRMHGSIFVRKEEKTIKNEMDLKNKEVLVMRGDTAHEYALEKNITDNLILTDTFIDAMKLLSEGEHDAVIVQQVVGHRIIEKFGIKNVIDVARSQQTDIKPDAEPLTGFEQKFCIAVKEGDKELLAQLNEGLSIVISNGTYDELYEKWFSPILPKPVLSLKVILKYVLLIIIPIIFLASIFTAWYLKYEVSKKTLTLIQEIEERKKVEESLRESEESYRSMMESMDDGVYICSDNFQIEYMNPAMIDMIGRDATGEKCHSAIFNNEEKCPWCVHEKVMKGKSTRVEIQKPNSNKVFIISHSPILHTDGTISKLSIYRDITEMKEMENKIHQSQKMESIGTLAGGIAHDFNNILTAILGNVTLARDLVDYKTETYELLSEAEKASKRAQSLTKQLLTFSKGGMPVKEIAPIKEIVEESALFVTRGSKSRCEVSIPENIWPAEADIGQINQTISNIVINANQAMPEGGVIHIIADNVVMDESNNLNLNPGKYIKISIKDEGLGIPEKHLSKIFDPYFSTKQKGSGLGLATAYSIINNHGGLITAESELGAGTTFNIYLPASEKKVPIKKKEKEIEGKGRVLVMDDEAALRKVLKRMLDKLGYEVEFSKDGAEAIGKFKKAKDSGKIYDVVILDLTVPGGMGGKEAIEKLLEIDPDVKAIVSSGYSEDPVMAKYQDYGFKGVVPKPFESVSLSKELHKVLKE